MEVKVETANNDAMGIKTEANSITECPRDGGPSIGVFGLLNICISSIHSLLS